MPSIASIRSVRGWRYAVVPLIAVALGVPASTAGAAASSGDPIPKAKLKVAGNTQRGWLWSALWGSSPEPQKCVGASLDGLPRPGRPLATNAKERTPRLVLRSVDRPLRVVVRDFKRVDANGFLVGASERLSTTLRPKRRGGQIVAWRARFSARGTRHHYLDVAVSWPEDPACGGRQANWLFHLQGR